MNSEEDFGVKYQPKKETLVIKKDGSKEAFDIQKVVNAVGKSAYRALTEFTKEEKEHICQYVVDKVDELGQDEIPISVMHNIVESVLEQVKPIVAKSYRDYRNYKQDFVRMLDEVYKKSQSIMYIGDKENANTDSALVSTKRSLIFNQLNKELYQKFFMTTEEIQACRDGYIYVHDMSARRDTMNCFARSTRFITDKGVKSFYDFTDGDEIRVLSHKGIWRKAVVHSYGWQKIQKVTFQRASGKEKSVLVTPNHRWILKDGTETTNLSVGDKLCKTPDSNCGDRTWFVKKIEPATLNPKAQVWCLEVEKDHSFLLEGGIPTGNCCLFDVESVLSGGFEMGNVWYNEPKSLDVAFDVIGDIVLSAASQQYGGFTIPNVENILEPYAEKSYAMYVEKYTRLGIPKDKAEEEALADVEREFEQGFQGWEYKFNTVGSSRGDYPFITVTAGTGAGRFAKMATISMLNVRRKGQGKKECKKPVLFPKIVFLYDENLHGPGKPLEDVFEAGVRCSAKTMYPDWLSLTGQGYVPSMYKQYGKIVSPMGCVDGEEIITYKWNNKLYVESFKRMWNRLADVFEAKGQRFEKDTNLYMDLKGVQIYDTQKGFVKVNRIIRNLSTDWRHVKFTNGRQLLCTADHPFEIEGKGVVFASDLTPGVDKTVINSEQYSEESKTVDNDYAWMMGVLLCDGCYKDSAVRISIAAHGEDEIQSKFEKIVSKIWGYQTKVTLHKRGVKGIYKDVSLIANPKLQKLSSLDSDLENTFGGYNKKSRHIPNEVFMWTRSAKLAFLAGMVDADGYVNPTSHGGAVVQIGSTNKELALQQMALAQALGYPAKIYCNKYKKGHPNIRYRIEFFAEEELIQALSCEKKKSCFKKCTGKHIKTEAVVSSVTPMHFEEPVYSYDVSTESEHFEVSGIYSHNCRAFLSPWYERGGMHPADDKDVPVFVGRFNIGAVSLHLPMILAKARQESRDFYEVLDYYLNLIRKLHIRTYAYLGEMRASTNPLAYCEGGFLGGHLKLTDKIKPLLKSATASFGITALNELQELYNGKSLVEDGQFALDVLEHINAKVNEFKEEDGNLYAIYGTPAENLCFTGDTEIQTYKGNVPIKDIVAGDLVYTFNEEKQKIELKEVLYSAKTKKNAKIIEVKFDNGQTVKCTPEHKFAVRISNKDEKTGKFAGPEHIEWVCAKDLKPGNRIKSNYISLNVHGRPECSVYYKGRHQLIQDINAEYAFGEKPKGYVTHHKDENKENNAFENLEYKTAYAHKSFHAKNLIPFRYTSDSQKGDKNSFYGKHHSIESKRKNRLAHMGNSVEVYSLDMQHITSFECIEDAERAGYTRFLIKKACQGHRNHIYKNMLWFYTKDCVALEANHKVASVEYLDYVEDVYDITVKDNHNFFVGGSEGILVHNCGLQIKQFRGKYGIIPGVSDREYVSNSFHCHVTEDITPIQKQDLEKRFWNLSNGGKIQYVKYPIDYNLEAIKTLVRRAMDMGFYEGVNLSLAYCDDCGHQELEMDVCPKCGSRNLTKIDRMNGYLSYSRVHGDTRLNDAKMAEIAERKSM